MRSVARLEERLITYTIKEVYTVYDILISVGGANMEVSLLSSAVHRGGYTTSRIEASRNPRTGTPNYRALLLRHQVYDP